MIDHELRMAKHPTVPVKEKEAATLRSEIDEWIANGGVVQVVEPFKEASQLKPLSENENREMLKSRNSVLFATKPVDA